MWRNSLRAHDVVEIHTLNVLMPCRGAEYTVNYNSWWQLKQRKYTYTGVRAVVFHSSATRHRGRSSLALNKNQIQCTSNGEFTICSQSTFFEPDGYPEPKGPSTDSPGSGYFQFFSTSSRVTWRTKSNKTCWKTQLKFSIKWVKRACERSWEPWREETRNEKWYWRGGGGAVEHMQVMHIRLKSRSPSQPGYFHYYWHVFDKFEGASAKHVTRDMSFFWTHTASIARAFTLGRKCSWAIGEKTLAFSRTHVFARKHALYTPSTQLGPQHDPTFPLCRHSISLSDRKHATHDKSFFGTHPPTPSRYATLSSCLTVTAPIDPSSPGFRKVGGGMSRLFPWYIGERSANNVQTTSYIGAHHCVYSSNAPIEEKMFRSCIRICGAREELWTPSINSGLIKFYIQNPIIVSSPMLTARVDFVRPVIHKMRPFLRDYNQNAVEKRKRTTATRGLYTLCHTFAQIDAALTIGYFESAFFATVKRIPGKRAESLRS